MKRALSSYREDENNILVFFSINIKVIVKKNDIKSIYHMLDKKVNTWREIARHFIFIFLIRMILVTLRKCESWNFTKLVSLSRWKVTVYSILPRACGHISSFVHTGTYCIVSEAVKNGYQRAHFKTFMRPSKIKGVMRGELPLLWWQCHYYSCNFYNRYYY